MSALPRLTRNFASLTSTSLAGRLANALLTIAAARRLGVEDYGLYATALTILFIAQVLTNFGTGRVVIRDVAHQKDLANQYLTSTTMITFTLALISFILLPLFSPFIGNGQEERALLVVIGLSVAGHAFARPAEAILKAFERMVLFSSIRLIVMIATTGAGLWLIFAGFGVMELVWLQVVSVWLEALLFLLAIHAQVNRLKWQPSRNMVRRIIQFGAPIFAMVAIGLVQERSDILLLARISGTESVGLYTPAKSVVRYLAIIRVSAIAAIFPYLSTRWMDSAQSFQESYQHTFRLLIIYGIGIAVAVMFMADNIIELVFGSQYESSAGVLRILVWAMVFDLLAAPIVAAIIIVRDRLVQFLPFAGIIAIVAVSLNLVLIPILDYLGSAWAGLATAAVALLIHYWWIGRVNGLERPHIGHIVWRPILAGMSSALVFVLIGQINIWLAALPAAVAYIGILLILGAFRPRETEYVKQMVGRRIGLWKS